MKNRFKAGKGWMAVLLGAVLMLMLSGVASAHVTVWPKTTTQGAYEVFTVRVPSEKKDVETLKVQVKVPDGAEVSRYEPLPGWKVSLEKDASGKIVSLTWTADQGQGLTAEQFNEFKMSAKVAADAKELSWKAYQTYSDNSVVEWIGAPDADYPASVTMVGAGTGEGDGHGHGDGHGSADSHASAGSDDEEAEASDGNPLPLYLSIAALALGVIALIAAFARRSKH